MNQNSLLLTIENLNVIFNTDEGIVRAVNGIHLDLSREEFFGLVGESGSGKTVTGLSILRLIPSPPGKIVSGKVLLNGNDLLTLGEKEMKSLRGKEMSMVFQNPLNSLNPTLSVGYQLMRVIRIHSKEIEEGQDAPSGHSRREIDSLIRDRAIKMLERVGVGNAKVRLDQYPHQFSGGMRQRVMIAMALACRPSLLIADEPTTALDVTIQAQILWLLKDLQKDFKTTVLLITHDLSIVAQFCDRLAIMYAGKIVERGVVSEVFHRPCHPYTQGLLSVIPKMEKRGRRFDEMKGFSPDLMDMPRGCSFHPRCPKRSDICQKEVPEEIEITSTHKVSCFEMRG